MNAALAANQIQAGPNQPLFPPTGAYNAAILKTWLIGLAQQATLIREGALGGPAPASGVVPAIT